jgi:hypothetical protein
VARSPHRVEIDVDGTTIWFACDDVPLTPAPEAAAAALTMVAALLGRPLTLARPVDPAFALGLRLLDRTVRRWWGVPVPLPPLHLRGPSREETGRAAPGRVAACFTCGVDSFHLLASQRDRIDDLLFVRGYDIPLGDQARAEATERRVRDVAHAAGVGAIVVRTNLRETRPFRDVSWEITHGSALAAVGHLLSGRIGELLIGSSYGYAADRPWGSHWRIDRRWGSRHLRVRHVGQHLTRVEKVAVVGADPLAAAHLQVCWQHAGATGNCGRCAKCVLTMAMLDHVGALDRFSTLPVTADLPARLAGLPPDALYGPSLAAIASGRSLVAEAAREHLRRGVVPVPPTPRLRRLADRLALP